MVAHIPAHTVCLGNALWLLNNWGLFLLGSWMLSGEMFGEGWREFPAVPYLKCTARTALFSLWELLVQVEKCVHRDTNSNVIQTPCWGVWLTFSHQWYITTMMQNTTTLIRTTNINSEIDCYRAEKNEDFIGAWLKCGYKVIRGWKVGHKLQAHSRVNNAPKFKVHTVPERENLSLSYEFCRRLCWGTDPRRSVENS